MQKSPPAKTTPSKRRNGFTAAGHLVAGRVRTAGAARGFALPRLLTHWADIVGPDFSDIATPVEVKYGREGGFGATLTVLCPGAQAPMLEMMKPKLLERLNACYGYSAIARIRITQTAAGGFATAGGFAEAQQAGYRPMPDDKPKAPPPHARAKAAALADGIADPGLRAALERLGGNVLGRQ